MKHDIKIAEEIINGMVKGGISPAQIAIAFHNALCHGKLHDLCYGEPIKDDDTLSLIINSAEKFIDALKKCE